VKLRVRDNSIRLRLSQSEVQTLRNEGLVSAALNFPGGTVIDYVLESTPASVRLSAQYAHNTIRVRVPESVAKEWADSDQVSISSEQNLDDVGVLTLLVEKDFACLSPRENEDESDMFVQPNEGNESC
jgi:hypothetical protein